MASDNEGEASVGIKWERVPLKKGTSFVWKHMMRSTNKKMAKCDLCPKTFSFHGATAVLGYHLKNKHRIEDPSKTDAPSPAASNYPYKPTGARQMEIQTAFARKKLSQCYTISLIMQFVT